MRKPDNSPTTVPLEPSRQRLILDRLQGGFYDEPEPADRIATAVLTALREPDKGSTLPH